MPRRAVPAAPAYPVSGCSCDGYFVVHTEPAYLEFEAYGCYDVTHLP